MSPILFLSIQEGIKITRYAFKQILKFRQAWMQRKQWAVIRVKR